MDSCRSQQELKGYFRWFFDVLPQKTSELTEAVRQLPGFEDVAIPFFKCMISVPSATRRTFHPPFTKGYRCCLKNLPEQGKLIAVAYAVLVFLSLLFLFGGMRSMARKDTTLSNIKSLAVIVETYRKDAGKYLGSIDELISNSNPENASRLRRIVINPDREVYRFHLTTNGFVITVTPDDPKRIGLRKWDRLEKRYNFGDALQ